MNFSLEIGPKTDLDTLPALKDVYVTMLPGGDYKETSEQAAKLVKKGFNPIPHFPARSIENEAQLKDFVNRCKNEGVKKNGTLDEICFRHYENVKFPYFLRV